MKFILFNLFVIFLLFTGSVSFGQKRPSLSGSASITKQSRSPIELMNLITGRIMKTYELKDGEYIEGDWNALKKSKAPQTLYWSYPTGVCLLAMQRVYDITRDENIIKYIENNNRISADQYAYLRWQKDKFGTIYKTQGFEKLWRLDMLDDCGAMGAAILETKLKHNVQFTQHVNELVDIIGNFVTNVQYRLPDGTFWRPNSPDGPTIWGDDLYMSLPCLIRWGEYKNDPSALDDASNQIINYASRMQDNDGIWYHAFFVDKNQHSCCKWGRANGWIAVAITEVLSVLPESHPKYKQVFDIYKKHVDGLKRYQASDGLWYQVIDHREISWGTETSCSACFTYMIARGINRGWLDASYIPVVEKSLAALSDITRISPEGEMLKVCASTSIGLDLHYYDARPVEANKEYSHGSGLALFALTEMHTLLQNKNKISK